MATNRIVYYYRYYEWQLQDKRTASTRPKKLLELERGQFGGQFVLTAWVTSQLISACEQCQFCPLAQSNITTKGTKQESKM